ncbi:MAG: imidazole glycerol phosphate synthase subunit HisH [candidate division KSB1 bacterium]|nr:imidazole glycerol phosphate synthase subunit HisH [candidate division KSB1 bacterium]
MIAVVDYGAGNLRSVEKALQAVGGDARLTDRPEEIRKADRVVLPGVGAFGDAAQRLRRLGLADAVLDVIRAGRPFLGICLGLQLLFERSEESSETPGLALLAGVVRRFPPQLKVPHLGWNAVRFLPSEPMFASIPQGSYFYFAHSFYADTPRSELVAGITEYGVDFPSALCWENVWAVQFHPEKSQRWGLQLLRNFLAM